MSLCRYRFERVFYFMWRCDIEHLLFGHIGTGFGFTKRQAMYFGWK